MKKIILFLFILILIIIIYGTRRYFIQYSEQKTEYFTLEQILGFSFPSNLIANKQGDKLGWIYNNKGKHSLWLAQSPEFTPKQLTLFDNEDCREISNLIFSPDSTLIALVHGSSKNKTGEFPNPSNNPITLKREVLLINTETGKITNFGEGRNPFFSHNGENIIFQRDDNLTIAAISSESVKQMLEIRGKIVSPTLSPDGSQLAFVSHRNDHSFIAIFDFKTSKLKFLSPSVDFDTEPRWSPDGKLIAFIRSFNIAKNQHINEKMEWAINIVNPKNDKLLEIWHSGKSETDAFSEYPNGNILEWFGNRLLFSSEQDGWFHLYSIDVPNIDDKNLSSKKLAKEKLLTPGNFEVEMIDLSADRTYAIISTNQGDVDRRHLWKIDLENLDNSLKQITFGDGIEAFPVILNKINKIAFLHSNYQTPPSIYITSETDLRAGRPKMQPIDKNSISLDFPGHNLVKPEQAIFKANDGTVIHGQLFKPENSKNKTPGIIFLHGGPPRQMLLGWHYYSYYSNTYAFNQFLANHGYMVLSINFRGSVGYGYALREAKNRGKCGASEYQDILAAAKYLSAQNADPKKIGLWGGSYGGYLTALGLARNSDIFAAGVDLHGVHDWGSNSDCENIIKECFESVKKESSPLNFMDKWKSPILLIHGDDDRNVEFSQSILLASKLRKYNIYFEQLIFPDEVHSFLCYKNWIKAYHTTFNFFEKYLKNIKY